MKLSCDMQPGDFHSREDAMEEKLHSIEIVGERRLSLKDVALEILQERLAPHSSIQKKKEEKEETPKPLTEIIIDSIRERPFINFKP